MSSIYTRDFYVTEKFDYVISKKITEYDMHEAGWNLILYYDLLPENKKKYLSTLDKESRKIQIGVYMKHDRKFNEKLTESFGQMRKLFFEANELTDDDIISIKKDALFVLGKTCNHCKFGNVEFASKHVYSSYHKFDNNIELYYSYKENKLDVKGISDSLLCQHEKFMKILKHLFKLLEKNDMDSYVEFMKKFVDDYKNKRLALDYYREFNAMSGYSITYSLTSYKIILPNMTKDTAGILDISYNYINYILPMIQRFYFGKLIKK